MRGIDYNNRNDNLGYVKGDRDLLYSRRPAFMKKHCRSFIVTIGKKKQGGKTLGSDQHSFYVAYFQVE